MKKDKKGICESMKNFTKPLLEVISFNVGDDVVTSSDPACDKGNDNLGWTCGGDKTVTCDNLGAYDV